MKDELDAERRVRLRRRTDVGLTKFERSVRRFQHRVWIAITLLVLAIVLAWLVQQHDSDTQIIRVRAESLARCEDANARWRRLGDGLEEVVSKTEHPQEARRVLGPIFRASDPIDCKAPRHLENP